MLVLVAVAALGNQFVSEAADEGSSGHPDILRFEELDEARSHVPYEIRTPKWAEPHEVTAVYVHSTPVYLNPKVPSVTVDIFFRVANDASEPAAMLSLSNYEIIPWGHNAEDAARLSGRNETELDGSNAVVATSIGGTGYVNWDVGEVSYQLQYQPRGRGHDITVASRRRSGPGPEPLREAPPP